MRVVSFVDKLEFEFAGNIFKGAIALGDVDNDGNNELAVGNMNGDVVIFKGRDTTPWKTSEAYGMVTSIVIGDILNEESNQMVTITNDGWCNIYVINPKSENGNSTKLKPFHTQRLMANAKMSHLIDVDGDGFLELVIVMTDRVVRSYRWTKPNYIHQTSMPFSLGKLVAQNKWEFANQIGGVALNNNHDGNTLTALMVSQPGGAYMFLECYGGTEERQEERSRMKDPIEPVEHHPIPAAEMRNPNVSTEIVGAIKRNDGDLEKAQYYAIATLDGTLMFLENDQIVWSMQVDHQLFVLTKLNVTCEKGEEIIVCSWDGHTYIINQDQQSLRFQFDEDVSTFTAGLYALSPGNNVPCLVYVTFNNRIYLYYNIYVPQIPIKSLMTAVGTSKALKELMRARNVDPEDTKNVQKLIHWMLYGCCSKSKNGCRSIEDLNVSSLTITNE